MKILTAGFVLLSLMFSACKQADKSAATPGSKAAPPVLTPMTEPSQPTPRVSSDTSSDGVYSRLRHQALSTNRSLIRIPEPSAENPVWGVMMETDYDGMTVSLFALLDGTSSLYFSNGGGVIGGHAHEEVRRANAAFIRAANQFRNHFQPCDSYPIPETDRTVFYVLTDSGILTASALENDLGNGKHSLSALFYAGHDVITQLRLISDDSEDDE